VCHKRAAVAAIDEFRRTFIGRFLKFGTAFRQREPIDLHLFLLTRLSHLKSIFGYFCLATGIKLNACNRGMPETVAVKTYPL